jgi:hypothetical protein
LAILILAVIVVFCFLLTRAQGQETKPVVAPLSSDEEIALLAAQKEQMRAEQVYQAANKRLIDLVQKVYADRKIEIKDYTLCDGPGPVECKDVPQGRIALRLVPKKEAK